MIPSTIGIAWYHEADYNGLREMFEDGRLLASTYQEWLEISDGLVEFLESQGVVVEKVYITPENFPIWCGDHELRLNNKARGKFVASVVNAVNKNTA